MPENKEPVVVVNAYPFYVKATIILFGLILFGFILRILSTVLVPFGFSCLIAILLNPLCNRLERKLPRSIAIFCAVFIAIVVVGGIFFFLSTQIFTFSEALPALKAKFNMLGSEFQVWINSHFGISISKQLEMLNNALQAGPSYVGQTLSNLMDGIGVLVLIPIYVYFILFYKPLILDFLFQSIPEKHSLRVAEILAETKNAIQSYIVGLLIEMAIVSVMNSAALLALGVRSAILIGVIGGILNVIPYLGGLVAIALPILMVTISQEGYSIQLAIVACYIVIQLIDNNILVPKIVSSKVEINALFSILVVLCGGLLWSYSGMFLSIPFVAILKIIFDRIAPLRPWGQLLGTKIPAVHSGVRWQAHLNKRLSRRDAPMERTTDITSVVVEDVRATQE